MVIISGSVKIVSSSIAGRASSDRCMSILSDLVVSIIYLVILFSAGWIRSKPYSLEYSWTHILEVIQVK